MGVAFHSILRHWGAVSQHIVTWGAMYWHIAARGRCIVTYRDMRELYHDMSRHGGAISRHIAARGRYIAAYRGMGAPYRDSCALPAGAGA